MLTKSYSERKWKEKLKEWGFEKYLSANSMKVIVAKSDKRKLDEGKETVFYHHGAKITSARIETFKKRKATEDMDVVWSNAGKYLRGP